MKLGPPPERTATTGTAACCVRATTTGHAAALPSRRVGEDVTTLTPHRSGRAVFPLPVLHGRASLTDVVADTIPDSPVKKVAEVKTPPLVSFLPVQLSVVV